MPFLQSLIQPGFNCTLINFFHILLRKVIKMSWSGAYQFLGGWYPMHLTFTNIEVKIRGIINCEGYDEVGQFTMQGSFINGSNQLQFVKQYIGQHHIYYKGVLNPANDSEITGFWSYEPGMKNGRFKFDLSAAAPGYQFGTKLK